MLTVTINNHDYEHPEASHQAIRGLELEWDEVLIIFPEGGWGVLPHWHRIEYSHLPAGDAVFKPEPFAAQATRAKTERVLARFPDGDE